MVRDWLLAACVCGAVCGSVGVAEEPASPMSAAQQAYEAQRAHAWELIHERAARLQQERRARLEARKRIGYTRARPVRSGPPYQRLAPMGAMSGRYGGPRLRPADLGSSAGLPARD